jgi:hypothetical protein
MPGHKRWAGGQEATADGFLAGVCTPVLGRPKPHPKVLSPAGGVGKTDSNKVSKFVKAVKIPLSVQGMHDFVTVQINFVKSAGRGA